MSQLAYPTDLIKLTRELRRRLEEGLVDLPNGCRVFPRSSIQVEFYGTTKTAMVSVQRIAWALAHPTDHLMETDFAVHTCHSGLVSYSSRPNSPVCCHPDHLIKGTEADVTAARLNTKHSRRESHA